MSAPHIIAALGALSVAALAIATLVYQLGASWPAMRAYLLLEPQERAPSLSVDLAGFLSLVAMVAALQAIVRALHS